jgi:Tetratricopeptide repeat
VSGGGGGEWQWTWADVLEAAAPSLGTGTDVGVASVPLVVVLAVASAWAERGRELPAGLLRDSGALPEAEAVPRGVVVGDVPQEPAAFVVRPELEQALTRADSRVSVLFALTGLRGVGNPDTLGARRNLAEAYQLAGRLDEAIGLYRQTVADAQRVLGPDHALTRRYSDQLAAALSQRETGPGSVIHDG